MMLLGMPRGRESMDEVLYVREEIVRLRIMGVQERHCYQIVAGAFWRGWYGKEIQDLLQCIASIAGNWEPKAL